VEAPAVGAARFPNSDVTGNFHFQLSPDFVPGVFYQLRSEHSAEEFWLSLGQSFFLSVGQTEV
jgi:hypothetical protein